MKSLIKHPFVVILFLILISLPAALPLLHNGFFVTDDAEWMIIRFTAFYQALHDGQFPVRFLDRLNFGYGYPVATFLYPGFMYFAVILHLLKIGFVVSIKIILGSSIILSGIFAYLWLRKLFDTFSSLVGSLFYVYTPYHLYDLYKRGSVGELLALAIVPFIFWQIERKSFVWSSIGIGFLIISHNTMAVLFLPVIVAYLVYLILQAKHKKPLILNSFFILLTGLGLSAFFWIPVLFELHKTVFAKTTVSDWSQYFASTSIIGYSTIAVLLITIVNFYFKKITIKKYRLAATFFVLTGILLFFSTPFSDVLWTVLPSGFIQFPFRLLSVVLLCVAFLAALNISIVKGSMKMLLGSILLVILCVSAFPFAKPSAYFDKEEGYYSTNDATTTVQDEYMPIWVKEKPRQRFTKKAEFVLGQGEINTIMYTNNKTSFNVDIKKDAQIRVHTIYWPGWNASIDGKSVPILYNNQRGLIELAIPQGKHGVEVKFSETPIRLTADVISLLSLAFLAFYRFKRK
jgi:hypothetical protein